MNAPEPVIDQRLQLLRRHWRQHPLWQTAQARTPHGREITVAISREAGAPGMEVAQHIGTALGWHVYDREILDLVAAESGLRSELLQEVDERDRHWLVEAISSFGQHNKVNTPSFVHHLVQVMAALAARGRCVVVGRGAAACLPRDTTLRVRVLADMEDRVHRVALEHGLPEDEARRMVQRVDRERSKFVASHFRRDILDAHNFDIVVNASRISPAACADMAVRAVHEMQAAARQAPAAAAGQATVVG
ncbi:MAG TPA: cytidylate kinase-like family protein [Lacipirellulaceae bacterium]|nr:cytidylate kinase-like family protein [Lacipirellulaceae bacterium]